MGALRLSPHAWGQAGLAGCVSGTFLWPSLHCLDYPWAAPWPWHGRVSVWECMETAEMILGVLWQSGVDAYSMTQQSGLGHLAWFINVSPELLN